MNNRTLIFDIWGEYAHFRKIFATTSQLTYIVPSKTSLYGYIGAIMGLEKRSNEYLQSFPPGSCQLAIQIKRPLTMQRISSNLRAGLGRMKATDNRKPTMIEYVYRPYYRIYFRHQDSDFFDQFATYLRNHQAVFTPTLGLANCLSNFAFVGEGNTTDYTTGNQLIDSVIPRSQFIQFDTDASFKNGNEIVEQSQFALEMNADRVVTQRDDIFLDRNGNAVQAHVKSYSTIETSSIEPINVIFL